MNFVENIYIYLCVVSIVRIVFFMLSFLTIKVNKTPFDS